MYHVAFHRLAEAASTGTSFRTGPSPATRAGTTGSTGTAARSRRSVRAPMRSTAWSGAGTPPVSTATSGAPPGDRPGDTFRDGRPAGAATLRPSLPPGQEEPPLDSSSAAVEALILGLRTDDGVPLTAFLDASLAEALAWADEADLVEQTEVGRVRLTVRGRMLSNEVFARLI